MFADKNKLEVRNTIMLLLIKICTVNFIKILFQPKSSVKHEKIKKWKTATFIALLALTATSLINTLAKTKTKIKYHENTCCTYIPWRFRIKWSEKTGWVEEFAAFFAFVDTGATIIPHQGGQPPVDPKVKSQTHKSWQRRFYKDNVAIDLVAHTFKWVK
jgi:hypothetical protein